MRWASRRACPSWDEPRRWLIVSERSKPQNRFNIPVTFRLKPAESLPAKGIQVLCCRPVPPLAKEIPCYTDGERKAATKLDNPFKLYAGAGRSDNPSKQSDGFWQRQYVE